MWYEMPKDSPVVEYAKSLPRGDGKWPGYAKVYQRLSRAAVYLSQGKYIYLSDDHVKTMAIMGCGHQETMKSWALICLQYGWWRCEDD